MYTDEKRAKQRAVSRFKLQDNTALVDSLGLSIFHGLSVLAARERSEKPYPATPLLPGWVNTIKESPR